MFFRPNLLIERHRLIDTLRGRRLAWIRTLVRISDVVSDRVQVLGSGFWVLGVEEFASGYAA